ncbi:hypothetical protein H5P28_11555 [Ruficoccus amylovorans]|uniref:Uncharacterized protein n=1 Tax=Ruficoccus amylovorans TaxID=1804625 RepID=A0A842HEE8_9BACT|nr:XF1762 family protein [Ruficoccus amylovorans]MBC2594893.1 hypothetical protein [Ruficoccus amylovorans]
MSALSLKPISLKEANAYVAMRHRHHGPTQGHKFSVGITDGEKLRGVAIAGRPVARKLDDGQTLEVTRCCTDGVKNGCSMLYRAVWKAAVSMGYKRMVTYTLESEPGRSLHASGFKRIGLSGGGEWSRPSRKRNKAENAQPKVRWQIQKRTYSDESEASE